MSSRYGLWSLALFSALHGCGAFAAANDAVQFDLRTLEARGYSADLAEFFSRSPRFLPGSRTVTISVNASRRDRVDATFDSNGDLCFNAALARELNLRHDPATAGCMDPAVLWPGLRVKLFPGQFFVQLTIPEDAFDPKMRESAYQSGGTGALVNYDLFMQRVDASSNGSQYIQATVEPGLNVANWSIRSLGVFTQMQGEQRYSQQAAYAQRPVDSLGALMQFGQLNAFGENFGGLPMLGFQIGTDNAQTGAGRLVVPIQGIAGSRATIEVRQRGRVVYRTVVRPGPFSLSNVSGLTGGADIDVEVLEENGQRQRFNVPVRTGAASIQQSPVWTTGIGIYRDPADETDTHGSERLLAIGEYAFNPADRLRLTTSGLFAQGYRSLAMQSTLTANETAWVSGGLRYARTTGFGQGVELSMLGSAALGSNFAGSLSWLSRSSRYAASSEAFGPTASLNEVSRFKYSAGGSISWAHPRWGALSYVLNYNRYYNDDSTGGFAHTINASRRIGRGNINVALQMNPGGNYSVYANFSMPLGGGSLRNNVGRSPNAAVTASTSYDGQFGRDRYYSLGVSGDTREQRFSASANMNTAYTQLGGGISQTTGGTRSAYLSATGALVYADGLVGTASSHVSDTFAMVSVPDHAGVRVTSPSSTSITNAAGTAVIPSIPPYTKSEVRIDTRSLSPNTRLATTTVDLAMRRGSVATQRIAATEVRQLLLDIRDSAGTPVQLGTTVYDEAGGVLGMIVGDGNFMLVNEQIGKELRLGNRNACRVSYSVPERFDPENPYEEVKATCG